MRTSDLFVLAAKLVTITGLDYKTNPEITSFERDAIDTGLRELKFYEPGFITRHEEKSDSLAARTIGKPGRPPKGI